jgi:putative ABC transport system permease protein
MSRIRIALSYLLRRPFQSLLTIVLVALAVFASLTQSGFPAHGAGSLIARIALLFIFASVFVIGIRSVIERRAEIRGLKILGATRSDVFLIFWEESALITMIGGIFGCGAAWVWTGPIGALLRKRLSCAPNGCLFAIDWILALSMTGVAILVGLLGGMIPAWLASRIRPVETCRGKRN